MRSRSLFATAVAAVALMVPTAIISCGSDETSGGEAADAAAESAVPDAARPNNDGALPPKDAAGDVTLDAGADADADAEAGPTAKLVVHSRASSVIIGDGTRFRQTPVDEVAIFDDAALIDAGPLDVTEIKNGPSGPRPMTTVATLAGVTISEVWMPSSYGQRFTGRKIYGTVEGVADGGLAAQAPGDAGFTLDLFHAGGQFTGIDSDAGTFRVDVVEASGTTYAVGVFAMDNQTRLPFRAGVVPVVLNPDGGDTTISLPMDHRVDETLTVTMSTPGVKSLYSVVYYSPPGADRLDLIGEGVLLKSTTPMMDRAPPFDTWDRWAFVSATGAAAGTLVRKIPPGGSSLAVTSPPSPTLDAPAISGVPPYPEMATDSAVYTWTAIDPQASLVKIRLSQVDGTSWFDWTVYAPSSAGTYKMFPLPADLATLPFAVKDKSAAINFETFSMEKISNAQDVYARPRGIFYLAQEMSQMSAPGGQVRIK